jgi:hypothetical protein
LDGRYVIVELLGYAPDADPTVMGVLTNASAVVPSLKGLKGAPSATAVSMATLAATCQGSAVLTKLDGTTRFLAATATNIYEAGASTWTDVSRAATYTASASQRYRFAQLGDVSLAANGADTIQASASGAFSCISGAPIAGIVETVGSFVFGFNTATSAQGWQCAGIGGYTSWTPSIATQATSGTLTATPGAITGARRFGSSIVAFKKDSMYLGAYVGPPNIWNFDQIQGSAGAMSQESIVSIGTPENPKLIFMGADDFYLYDGAKPIPIGTNRVKLTVFNSLLQSRFYACAALHDKINNLVYFYYPVADSTRPDHCVVYNYRTDKWGVDDRQIEVPVEYVTPGMTYDSLGTSYATYADLPALSYDLAFQNSALALPGFFDTSHTIKTLTGASTSSSLTTGDFGDDERVTTFRRVRPRFLTKPTSATWTHQYRMSPGDTVTADTAVSLSNGSFDFLRSARWHRGTMALVGDWEMAGFSPDLEAEGLE